MIDPFTLALISAGVSTAGGFLESMESKKAEEKRRRAIEAAQRAYEARVAPIIAQMERQAAMDAAGVLSPQDIALQAQFMALQEQRRAQLESAERERIARAFAGFGEQYDPRALRAQQELRAANADADYEARLQYALSQRADIEARKARARETYRTIADLEAKRAELAMGVAEATPTTTSGIGRGLGTLGAAGLSFAGQQYAFQQQQDYLRGQYPSAGWTYVPPKPLPTSGAKAASAAMTGSVSIPRMPMPTTPQVGLGENYTERIMRATTGNNVVRPASRVANQTRKLLEYQYEVPRIGVTF